jgi:hypothetical protein
MNQTIREVWTVNVRQSHTSNDQLAISTHLDTCMFCRCILQQPLKYCKLSKNCHTTLQVKQVKNGTEGSCKMQLPPNFYEWSVFSNTTKIVYKCQDLLVCSSFSEGNIWPMVLSSCWQSKGLPRYPSIPWLKHVSWYPWMACAVSPKIGNLAHPRSLSSRRINSVACNPSMIGICIREPSHQYD